jgi:hypothetical protein
MTDHADELTTCPRLAGSRADLWSSKRLRCLLRAGRISPGRAPILFQTLGVTGLTL